MCTQNSSSILMIEPVAFGFNAETALNNHFQKQDDSLESDIQRQAHQEFVNMTQILRSKGIQVIAIKDKAEPHTPDSIFPNNWVSFHKNERIALYPMFANNRRLERRTDILVDINKKGFQFTEVANYSTYEQENRFLEGTGSMILDRVNRIAYAAISERTDKDIFYQFCIDFDYQAMVFSSFQSVNGKRLPIYHTNVMMSIANKYAVICLDTIDDAKERKMVEKTILNSGKKIIKISESQMHQFAGNMLQVKNNEDVPYLVMSQSAYKSLETEQIQQLEKYNELIIVPVPTIEKYGGGSVRCMMGEIF